MNDEITIGQLARQAGVRPSALRYYESIGVLPTPRRVNGQRRYDASTLHRLRVIQLAQRAGFSIAEIQTLLGDFAPETTPAERWRPLAEHKIAEIEALIARAHEMKRILHTLLTCGCVNLEQCGVAGDALREAAAATPNPEA